jgi:hypothetical protein
MVLNTDKFVPRNRSFCFRDQVETPGEQDLKGHIAMLFAITNETWLRSSNDGGDSEQYGVEEQKRVWRSATEESDGRHQAMTSMKDLVAKEGASPA